MWAICNQRWQWSHLAIHVKFAKEIGPPWAAVLSILLMIGWYYALNCYLSVSRTIPYPLVVKMFSIIWNSSKGSLNSDYFWISKRALQVSQLKLPCLLLPSSNALNKLSQTDIIKILCPQFLLFLEKQTLILYLYRDIRNTINKFDYYILINCVTNIHKIYIFNP